MANKKSKIRKRVVVTLSILSLFIALVSFELLSKSHFKQPGGSHKKIGTFGIEITDENRLEPYTEEAEDKRRLLVQFWYPTEHTKGLQQAVYHPHPEKFNHDVQGMYGVPHMLLSRLSKGETPAFTDAPLSAQQEKYPVLIFSHGFNGSRFQNTFQFTELASHGYIIVSIEHAFAASGTVFSDGSTASTQPLMAMHDVAFSDNFITTWSDDQIFVIDYLEKMNQDPKSPFYQKLDLDKLGIFGHSLGGATAAATLSRDERPKAGINMDGFYFGSFYQDGFTQPFLEIRSDVVPVEEITDKELEEWQMSKAYYQYLLFDEWNKRINRYARHGYQSIKVKGANHMSFSDLPLLTPFKWLLGKDIDRIHQQTNQYTLNFFNYHLKGIGTPEIEQ